MRVLTRPLTLLLLLSASLALGTWWYLDSDPPQIQYLTKMQVNANVSESDIGGVVEGQRAFFLLTPIQTANFGARLLKSATHLRRSRMW